MRVATLNLDGNTAGNPLEKETSDNEAIKKFLTQFHREISRSCRVIPEELGEIRNSLTACFPGMMHKLDSQSGWAFYTNKMLGKYRIFSWFDRKSKVLMFPWNTNKRVDDPLKTIQANVCLPTKYLDAAFVTEFLCASTSDDGKIVCHDGSIRGVSEVLEMLVVYCNYSLHAQLWGCIDELPGGLFEAAFEEKYKIESTWHERIRDLVLETLANHDVVFFQEFPDEMKEYIDPMKYCVQMDDEKGLVTVVDRKIGVLTPYPEYKFERSMAAMVSGDQQFVVINVHAQSGSGKGCLEPFQITCGEDVLIGGDVNTITGDCVFDGNGNIKKYGSKWLRESNTEALFAPADPYECTKHSIKSFCQPQGHKAGHFNKEASDVIAFLSASRLEYTARTEFKILPTFAHPTDHYLVSCCIYE
jgi:hypothetical protein